MVTETRWFTSATLDLGSLAPQYESVSKTTAGLDICQCVSVSTLTQSAKRARCDYNFLKYIYIFGGVNLNSDGQVSLPLIYVSV